MSANRLDGYFRNLEEARAKAERAKDEAIAKAEEIVEEAVEEQFEEEQTHLGSREEISEEQMLLEEKEAQEIAQVVLHFLPKLVREMELTLRAMVCIRLGPEILRKWKLEAEVIPQLYVKPTFHYGVEEEGEGGNPEEGKPEHP